jgi:O-antigen/teichoic acid export membrane protein
LYTAILEPEVYGIADLFNSYIYLIIPLVSLMLDQGLFRFLLECREDEKRKKTLLSTVLLINGVEIIIYLLIYMVIQRFIGSQYKIFLLIDVALNILLNTLLQFARGVGKNGVYAISSFLSASMTVVSNVVKLDFLRMGAWGLFISTVIGRSIALIVTVILLKTWRYFEVKEFSKDEAKRLMSYSLPFIPNQ